MDEHQNNIAYAWVDIETTGLSAQLDVPLEIGIALTDKVGNKIAEASWVVYEECDDYKTAIKRAKEHEIVGPMHEKSGLWDDLKDIDNWNFRSEVDLGICDFLDAWGVRFGKIGMAGNSTGSLDRPFVLVHFPMLNDFLGYRNIDMSSLKEICKRNNAPLYEKLVPIIGTKEDAPHRTLGDIDACIKEFQAYLDNFIFTED